MIFLVFLATSFRVPLLQIADSSPDLLETALPKEQSVWLTVKRRRLIHSFTSLWENGFLISLSPPKPTLCKRKMI